MPGKFTTKLGCREKAWVMRDDKARELTVLHIVIKVIDSTADTAPRQYVTYTLQLTDDRGISCGQIEYTEPNVFASKQELLDSL